MSATPAPPQAYSTQAVYFDENGIPQKGNATDRQYQEAVNRYKAEAERDYIGSQQAVADKQYDTDAQAIRDAAERGQEELASSRDRTRREAGILMERMGRYLGNVQRVSGTAGTGAADADAVRRYNEVIRQMEDANRSYEAGVTDITQTELEARTKLDIEKQAADAERQYRLAALGLEEAQGQIDIDDQFRQEERLDRQEEQALSTEQYATATTALEYKFQELAGRWGDGKISRADMEEMRQYAERVSGGLTERDRQNLELALDSYESQIRSDEEAKMVEEVVTSATVKGFEKDAKEGRNLAVYIGDRRYDVQIGQIVTAEEEPNVMAAAGRVSADTVFEVGGALYVKLSGNQSTAAGTVVKLEGRGASKTNGDMEQLRNALVPVSQSPETNAELIEAAGIVRNGESFTYGGVAYIKADDGKIYRK